MAFEDFSHLTERRKAQNKEKLKKRIIFGIVATFVVIILLCGGLFAFVRYSEQKSKTENNNNNNNNDNGHHSTSSPTAPKKQPQDPAQSIKAIKTLCSSSDYKERCEQSLKKAVSSNSSGVISQPKDLVKAAFSVTLDEVEKAFDSASEFEFNTDKEKAGFEDCKELIENAKEELNESISSADVCTSNDLNNWLSAVVSYQAGCVGAFPEGSKLRTQMEKTFQSAREMTSNSLAIISQAGSILSTLETQGTSRHLLDEEESELPSWMSHEDRRLLKGTSRHLLAEEESELPSWMSHEDRRLLKGGDDEKPVPNVVVAKDGSGQFTTISDALAAMPKKYDGRYILYVKQGIYEETVIVTKKMVNVTIYGDGSQKSIVTGNKNFIDGVRTFHTATFVALGNGFMAKAMGFRNTAGPEKHQAVAIRVQSDRSIFLNCRFEGYQDTLYAQTHRQFYRSCVIAGTVDFIFGDAAVLIQNSMIVIRKPLDGQPCVVTAQGRTDKHETTAIVIQNCRIMADKELPKETKSYLGRPWKEYSRTVIMESTIEDIIHPDGWYPWEGEFALKTLYYAEYNNKGPGAALDGRVKWAGYNKALTKDEALKFTVDPFLQADWIKASGANVHLGLF